MKFQYEANRLIYEDEQGNILAEIAFSEQDHVVSIEHTVVDPQLRGQGLAGIMTQELLTKLKQDGKKVRPVCAYTVRWMDVHPEFNDIREGS